MREKKKLHRSKDVHVLGKVPLQSLSLWLPLILEIEALPLKPSNLILVLLNAKHPENVFRILKEGGVGLLPQSLSPKPQQNLWKDDDRVLLGIQSTLSGQQQSPDITMKVPESQVLAKGAAHQPSLPRTHCPGTSSHSPPAPGTWQGLPVPLWDLEEVWGENWLWSKVWVGLLVMSNSFQRSVLFGMCTQG